MVGNCEMDCCSAYLFTISNNPFLKKKNILAFFCTHRVDTVSSLFFPDKYSFTIKHLFAKRRRGWLLKEFAFYVQIQAPNPVYSANSLDKQRGEAVFIYQ